MRAAGLRGVSRRRFVRTTVADLHADLPLDLNSGAPLSKTAPRPANAVAFFRVSKKN
jgi:hypothetical protein